MNGCVTQNDPCDAVPLAGEAWSVCLPFGGRIWADGHGVHAAGGIAPPDGVYGKVVIANGCIIGVEPEDVPVYTGNPCAPLPGDCTSGGAAVGGGGGGRSGGTGTGGTGGCKCALTPSSSSGNLFATDAAGRPLVRLSIRGGTGITVTGSGTANNPYVISLAGGGGAGGGITAEPVYMRSGNDAITITGAGTRLNPFVITHKMGESDTVNGMKFDAYGHFIGKVESAEGGTNKGITGIVPSNGITVTTDNKTGIATIGLVEPPEGIAGAYTLGGYNLTFDNWGRMYKAEREINLGAEHTVTCGDATLTINSLGSITKVSGGGGTGMGGGETPPPVNPPTTGGGGGSVVLIRFANRADAMGTPPPYSATFDWPVDAPAVGQMFSGFGLMNKQFDWSKLRVQIDGVSVEVATIGPVVYIPDQLGTGLSVSSKDGAALFWLGATLAAGQHTLTMEYSGQTARIGSWRIIIWPACSMVEGA